MSIMLFLAIAAVTKTAKTISDYIQFD